MPRCFDRDPVVARMPAVSIDRDRDAVPHVSDLEPVARRSGLRRDERALFADERIEQRRLADVDRTDERDRDALRSTRAAVTKSIGERRAARRERRDLARRSTSASSASMSSSGKSMRPSISASSAKRSLLERGDRLAEPAAEVLLREPPRSLAAGVNHLEQRLGAQQIELAVRDRAPRELAGLGDPRAARDHRRRAAARGCARRRGRAARRRPRR